MRSQDYLGLASDDTGFLQVNMFVRSQQRRAGVKHTEKIEEAADTSWFYTARKC